jgi:hypothetical protein
MDGKNICSNSGKVGEFENNAELESRTDNNALGETRSRAKYSAGEQ